MADYKKMYQTLLSQIENTMENFKNSMQEAEEIYCITDDNDEHFSKNSHISAQNKV